MLQRRDHVTRRLVAPDGVLRGGGGGARRGGGGSPGAAALLLRGGGGGGARGTRGARRAHDLHHGRQQLRGEQISLMH